MFEWRIFRLLLRDLAVLSPSPTNKLSKLPPLSLLTGTVRVRNASNFCIISRVSCPTPARTDLRTLGSESPKSVVSRLTVVKVYDNSPLASTNFTFYDCHQLSTCTECSSSRFPCDWCTLTSKCVPNAEDTCQGEPLVNQMWKTALCFQINSVGRQGPSSRRGADFCPRFTPVSPQQSSELFVPSGHKRQLSFRAHNLHDSMKNFKCQYTVDGTTHERVD